VKNYEHWSTVVEVIVKDKSGLRFPGTWYTIESSDNTTTFKSIGQMTYRTVA